MDRNDLIASIRKKRSMLCVGLDTDPERIPAQFGSAQDPVHAFNQAIIKATAPYAVAYKFNLAFYEAQGAAGWTSLERSLAEVPSDCFTIADAKRGDIGNTADRYAQAFFDRLQFDAVTLSPYMGKDSIEPFLGRTGKWAIVLAATSNPGAADVQFLVTSAGPVFEQVIEQGIRWGGPEELMFVVGATRPEILARARKLAPEHFLLVPGVGAQGGDLRAVLDAGMIADGGLLINSSRGILYAGQGSDSIPAATKAAAAMQALMAQAMSATRLD